MMREVDLVRGGAELDVTDENKVEYVERRFKHAMLDQITAPLSALLRGFYEVVVLFGIESEFEFFVVLPPWRSTGRDGGLVRLGAGIRIPPHGPSLEGSTGSEMAWRARIAPPAQRRPH